MNIAFSGGGVKGFSYIGVVQYLEETEKTVKMISGTSIGSLTGLMMCLGYSSSEMKNIIFNLNMEMLENIDITQLFSNYGLDNGSKISFFISYLIESKGFDKNITFNQLYEKCGIHMFITCCDIRNFSQKIFDYIGTPDYKVRDACRFSMSIPLIWTLSSEYYIDGCFSRNLPIEVLPVENTIGFSLSNFTSKPVEDLQSYVSSVLKCSMAKGNTLEMEKYKLLGYNIITIKTQVNALQLKLTLEEKTELIKIGYDACFLI
jgi:NTE family protein